MLNVPTINVNLVDDYDGQSAVHWAVTENNIEALTLLLKVPTIDLNPLANNGDSTLHLSVSCDKVEALKLLLNFSNIDVKFTL